MRARPIFVALIWLSILVVKWGVLCDEVGDHVWPCIRLAPVTHCSTLNCVAYWYMRKVSHVLQHLLRASNVMYQPLTTVATDYTMCVVGLLMSICTFQRSRICGPTRYKQPNRKNTQSKLLYQAQCKLICTHQCSQLHVQCVHDRFSLP